MFILFDMLTKRRVLVLQRRSSDVASTLAFFLLLNPFILLTIMYDFAAVRIN